MSDAKSTIEWTELVESICQRFGDAMRAGETFEGFEAWLNQVPVDARPVLAAELERHRAKLSAESIETRVLSSDAVIFHTPFLDDACEAGNGGEEIAAVRKCETFRGLSVAALDALQQRFRQIGYRSGTQVLRQGEQAQGLHLILSGFVDVVDTDTGERIACDGAGSVLGEMSLLMDQCCSADVIATSDVESLVLSSEDYHELKAEHPELEIALSQLVSDRLGGRRHDALCGKTIGGFTLKRCLNRGGMGVVYEANELTSGERVALKMLRHRFIYDDQMQSRFEQEARLLANLRHDNIVTLRENFLAYRTRFLVLDLCDGADLFQVLRARGPFDEPTVRAVLGQIAAGLLHAHQSGVVHRDLKPGNVLVDRNGHVRLTDFGLSRLLESEVPGGKAVGTPAYMPPEQFRTDCVGPECDFYALGCLICEMLTARILFTPSNWFEMFEHKRTKSPSDLWPAVNASPELSQIIHGCLQLEPSSRRIDLKAISRWAKKVDGLFQPAAGSDLSRKKSTPQLPTD